ncbi:MAG: tryptophan--tRNA ligase [Spirochaetota bacterium]|nr:tryptophan--tRNA ligase [Spirochaetota bacterium]
MSRILSGIQPSGQLHIGNYMGMMKPMIELQSKHELFCFIVNYHALTTIQNGEKLRKNTISAALDFLALGIDPDKCYFWVQSDIHEVVELSWILSCNTSLGLLERSHSYKDKIAKGIVPNCGLFCYPVLMAADILLFQAEMIPVGKDQKQHIEMTRDIAQRFNSTYGETFVLPEPLISDDIAIIPGIDGLKMSKSYDNAIYIFESEKDLKKKVMRIVTDSTPVEDPKDPDRCTVFQLYKLFADRDRAEKLRGRYQNGGVGYGDVKKELFGLMWDYFRPYREKRDMLSKDTGEIYQILQRGAEKTKEIARKNIEEVKHKIGLSYKS